MASSFFNKSRPFYLTCLPVFLVLFLAAGFVHSAEGAKGDSHKLTVKVVNADTGDAVANVSYYYYIISENSVMDRGQVKSDSNGEISLTVPYKSNVQLSLQYRALKGINCDINWMQKNGGLSSSIAEVTEDKEMELKIKIIPTLKLSGTVIDSKGQPVKYGMICYSQYISNVMTDNKGTFNFDLAPADRDYELFVSSSDRSEAKLVKVSKGTANLQVKLEPTFDLEGKAVVEDGKPAEKLQFRTTLLINGNSVNSISGTYTTDEEGKFTIKKVCEGADIMASWYSSSRSNANYWNGNQTITLQRDSSPVIKARRFIDDWDAPGNIAISEKTKCNKLSNYCLDGDDNILACDESDKVIRKISSEDKLLETWKMDFAPQAIDCKADGTIIVAGPGKIALLDKTGKVIEQNDMLGKAASGVGYTKDNIFVAISERTGFAILKMNDKLQDQKIIVNKLRGCCGQFDITARDGHVFAAANCNFRIIKYDCDGNTVLEMGEKGDTPEKGFAGCCEPKNLCWDKQGNLYASESGNCCVKRFSEDGKSFELLGKVNGIRGCVRVAIAVNSKGDKVYMLDTKRNIIRCLSITPKKVEVNTHKVTAKVIDAATNQPVADAVYQVSITTDGKRRTAEKYTSDSNGIFTFDVPKGSRFALYMRHSDSTKLNFDINWMQRNVASSRSYGQIKGDKEIELKVKVLPSVKLTCTVMDSKGSPVENAVIQYDRYTAGLTTDGKGVFVFEKAPADRNYELYIAAKDGSEAKIVKVNKGTTDVVVKLEPTYDVEGKAVIENGKPAAKLNFRTYLSLNKGYIYTKSDEYTADENGKFVIKNVCDGLKVRASWYSSSKANMDYFNGNAMIEFKKGQPLVLKAKFYADEWNAPGNIAISDETKCKSLSNYCLDPEDNILACDQADNVIRKISPEDKLLETWKLDFSPQAIDCKADGTVIVAGPGKVALLDKTGKVIKQADMAGKAASGVGYSKDDIFVAVRERTGFAILRMSDQLQDQKIIVTKLRGCCGQFDITARDGYVYAAANTKFRIYKYDRDGKMVLEMGEKGKKPETGFAGCCEPKNLCWDKNGDLYASESGNCCVKRFSADGKSFDLIGKVTGIRGCVRVSIAVNSKGDKVYMLDTKRSIIRCLPVPAKNAGK